MSLLLFQPPVSDGQTTLVRELIWHCGQSRSSIVTVEVRQVSHPRSGGVSIHPCQLDQHLTERTVDCQCSTLQVLSLLEQIFDARQFV